MSRRGDCQPAVRALRTRIAGRHLLELGGWLAPSAALALMPKCPACLAAYVALATGVGLSIPAAAQIRSLLIVACAASLALLAIHRGYRLVRSGRKARQKTFEHGRNEHGD